MDAEMPVPSALVARFVQLVMNRQFAEAERELERLKQKMHKTEWNRGYFRALYGILLVRSSDNSDSYSFLSKLDLNDKAALKAYRKEFLSHVRNRLHGDFDRGFFSAWADFIRILGKMDFNNAEAAKVNPEKEKGGNMEKSQASMEDFIE
ncbi:MAG: hypothetical protein QXE00_04770 [Candidatus Bathyarchaeia archaeon]